MSSTKQDWTPEPWITDGSKVEGNSPGAMHDIAHCPTHPHLDWTGSDNARRIVACVNALAGIPDPAAYIKAMREVCEAANRYLIARSIGINTRDIAGILYELDRANTALRTLSTPESEVKRG